mmetsp:Transcript_4710/g.9146  ORF Transcript_4710/g.9146 Transcript_4710/m.9146 type:complete len:961 (+) Transcript_4710:168-3050(+)
MEDDSSSADRDPPDTLCAAHGITLATGTLVGGGWEQHDEGGEETANIPPCSSTTLATGTLIGGRWGQDDDDEGGEEQTGKIQQCSTTSSDGSEASAYAASKGTTSGENGQNGHVADNDAPTTTPTRSRKRKSKSVTKFFLRSLLIDMPLALVFLSFVISASLLYVYDAYVTKILTASKWLGANRLKNEYTYYTRECMKEDLSTLKAKDLLIPSNATAAESTDTVMHHGMGIIPSVLTPYTTTKLREFVMKRNAELTDAEAIPLDGENERWSFGIGATEDPIVPVALREIASHPILRPTLENLMGKDPAVVEITAITSAFGAEDQGWHADVKPLGNAARYARTFTHSYSLFTALQDTTGAMGATEVCPGTHYCANELEEVCYDHGFKVAQGHNVWRAGDSLLLNQCAWHRGTEHTDPDAKHRVVFIVTFHSRPRFGIDNRQLPHGTYFHIRWDMWGHTLNDLLDAKRYMPAPLAAIRSAGIWKPRDRHWGWDWLTVACLRIANDQNGYTSEELVEWVHNFDVFGLPHFLRGPVSDRPGYGWEAFIRGTLERFVGFWGFLTVGLLLVYLFFTKVIYLIQYYWSGGKDSGLFRAVLRRLVCSYGMIGIATCAVHYMIYISPWAESIRSERFLMKPFPQASSVKIKTREGPTTVPSVYDVLIGSRFDSRDIGAYNNFLNYHPGNKRFSDWIDASTEAFTDSPILQHALISSIVNDISKNGGRFLQQNEIGFWVRLPGTESAEYTRKQLVKRSNPLLAALDEELAFMIADARYGPLRGSSLAQQYAQEYLFKWEGLLFGALGGTQESYTVQKRRQENSHGMRLRLFTPASVSSAMFHAHYLSVNDKVSDEDAYEFKPGDHVESNYDGFGIFFEARVRGVHHEKTGIMYDIEYTDGDASVEGAEHLRPYSRPYEEGDRVSAEVGTDRWCDATVVQVYPGRSFDVRCDEPSDGNIWNVGVDFIKRIS